LRRALEKYVENPLATRILKGDFKEGSTIIVDLEGEELVFKAGGESSVKESPQKKMKPSKSKADAE
jgi:ATP-dependent Clp protease ATP-binding subunit ClpC